MALPEFENSCQFSKTEKLVLRYAVAMTQTPVEVPDELFGALREIFNDQQLVELTPPLPGRTTAPASVMLWEWSRKAFTGASYACCLR